VSGGFDFICFQETILQDFSDSCLRKIDPSQNFFGIGSQPRGDLGGGGGSNWNQ
jgi:hypothetical protein